MLTAPFSATLQDLLRQTPQPGTGGRIDGADFVQSELAQLLQVIP